jgi:hypothetical protein
MQSSPVAGGRPNAKSALELGFTHKQTPKAGEIICRRLDIPPDPTNGMVSYRIPPAA